MTDPKSQNQKKIEEIISTTLGVEPEELEGNKNLREDLGASELEISDLLTHLEQMLKIHFDTESSTQIKTVKQLISLTLEKTGDFDEEL